MTPCARENVMKVPVTQDRQLTREGHHIVHKASQHPMTRAPAVWTHFQMFFMILHWYQVHPPLRSVNQCGATQTSTPTRCRFSRSRGPVAAAVSRLVAVEETMVL